VEVESFIDYTLSMFWPRSEVPHVVDRDDTVSGCR